MSGAIPPTGSGVFARAQSVAWLARFAFVCLPRNRADTPAKARDLKARRVKVYLYSTPEFWTPGAWPLEIARMRAAVASLGVSGFLCNAESGWADLPSSQRASLGMALGEALANAADHTSVGYVSYPMHPIRGAIAQKARGKIWASPEIYAKETYAADASAGRPSAHLSSWMENWRALFGAGSVIPSISGWTSNPAISNVEGYARYLAAVPGSPGSIAWTAPGATPDWMAAKAANFQPGGSVAGTLLNELHSVALNPGDAAAGLWDLLTGEGSSIPIVAVVVAAVLGVALIGLLIWIVL